MRFQSQASSTQPIQLLLSITEQLLVPVVAVVTVEGRRQFRLRDLLESLVAQVALRCLLPDLLS
jgi:hypothetical protein